MSNWKIKIEESLRGGMRYCFPQGDMTGKVSFPALSEEEFKGEDGDGFLYFILSVVLDARKKSFQDGFQAGITTATNGVIPRESSAPDKEVPYPSGPQPYAPEFFSLACGRAWEQNESIGTAATNLIPEQAT